MSQKKAKQTRKEEKKAVEKRQKQVYIFDQRDVMSGEDFLTAQDMLQRLVEAQRVVHRDAKTMETISFVDTLPEVYELVRHFNNIHAQNIEQGRTVDIEVATEDFTERRMKKPQAELAEK